MDARGGTGRPGKLPSPVPHRSGRAEFPHPALRRKDSLRAVDGVRDASTRQRIVLKQPVELLSRDGSSLGTACKPPPPCINHHLAKLRECYEVPGDAVVPVVPANSHTHTTTPGRCYTAIVLRACRRMSIEREPLATIAHGNLSVPSRHALSAYSARVRIRPERAANSNRAGSP